ncbi:hypothetical protein BBJ28_00018507 [Nothophytophthora sp. Chile5]|nr:hypothetical protein BBJ28_00018507 [Nothophytophthora sp. Chile5]
MQPMLQRVLGMDGAFMKTPKHGNTMVILVGRNGNNENVVLAVALCPSEDENNCLWFLRNCERAGILLVGIPLFMDRGKGGIAAGTTMGLQLRFCTRHIIGNMKSKFKSQFGMELESCVWAIQAAESEDEFTSRLDALAVANTDIAQYVRDIPAGQWALHTAIADMKLYGWRTTNFVESENNQALSARHMNPFDFFSALHGKVHANKAQPLNCV